MEEYKEIFEVIDSSITNTFVKIYKTMTTLEAEPITVPNLNDFKRSYSTTMGLNGVFLNDQNEKVNMKGSVVISWDTNSYVKMASLFLGEEYKEFCDEIDDVGMEIINTTVGNSKAPLSRNGVFVEMSLPTGFIGDSHMAESNKNVFKTLHVYNTTVGKVCVMINILIER